MLLLLLPATTQAQATDSTTFHPTRFWVMNGVMVAGDVAAMVALNELWYADYERTSFHWHDDWSNWLQQDKIGHAVTAFHIARAFGAYGQWSGLSRKKAALWGGAVSTIFQSQIELLDGTSAAWGASWGDIAMNTLGAVLGSAQVAWPEANFFTLRFSYDPRSPGYNPSEGTGNFIKDYDGQTYWLVLRPEHLLPERAASRWPDWLAVSFGHGGDGLCSALPTPECAHQRRLFVGLDFDVQAVDWPQPWMRTVATMLTFVRIPAPALEVYPRARWHWLFF